MIHRPLMIHDDEDLKEIEVNDEAGRDDEQLYSSDSPIRKITNHLAIRTKLLDLLGEPDSPQATVLGIVMIVIVVVSVAIFFPHSSRYVTLPPAIFDIEILVTIVFTVEYILRFVAADDILSWIISSGGLVDLLSFVPLYFELGIQPTMQEPNLSRAIRLLRVLRLVRVLKLFHYTYLYKRAIPYREIMQSTEYAFITQHKDVIKHIWAETYEQIKAVIPISLYAILYEYVVMGTYVHNLGEIFGGQVAVIVGLFLFLEGLKLSIMPLGEWVSTMLPRYIRLIFVMFAAFVLGIIVTYAEPAIGALSILGALVPRENAPYLSFLLAEWVQPLILFVGIGVGLAAAIGVLRVRYSWTLRHVIFISMVPCLLITFICVWAIPDLAVVIGLAWDCGAVTTGPVTVPVVLSLGAGVATSMGTSENVASSTFGIVTLASLFPIVTVQLLGLLAYFSVSKDAILLSPVTESRNFADETPYRETINGIRAIAPAVVFFFLIGRLVLKQRIPQLIHDSVSPPPNREDFSIDDTTIELSELSPSQLHLGKEILEDIPNDYEEDGPNATPAGKQKKNVRLFYIGVAAALVGMITFNYGITFGLAELGNQVGYALPGTFDLLDNIPDSPQYSYSAGVFLVALFALVLGYLCTQAEPGLIVFGDKVEKLKVMPKRTLIISVAAGVAIGMCFGVMKIIFNHQLIYYILITYSLALVMTYFSEEQVVCVAWDSAGVTTGEITVSFILVLGVSLSAASDSSEGDSKEGFGILTMASVGPIISVLASGFYERFKKRNTVQPT